MPYKYSKRLLAAVLLLNLTLLLTLPGGNTGYLIMAEETQDVPSLSSGQETPQSSAEPSGDEPIEKPSSSQEPEETTSSTSQAVSSSEADTSTAITSTSDAAEESDTEAGGTAVAEQSLYRLYSPSLRGHLYTKDANEYQVLATRGWRQEGIAWQTATKEGEPVYRLYNKGLKVHLYTKDTNEYQVLATRGWLQEGEAYRSYGPIPIYRLYNPSLKKHIYTKDTNEYNVLAARGWRQEGVAFYAVGAGSQTNPNPSDNPTDPSGVSADISIDSFDAQNGVLHLSLSNLNSSFEVNEVLFPVWSEENGQDDIKWYPATKQSDGRWAAAVQLSEHQYVEGNYLIHAYVRGADGKLIFLGETSTKLQLQKPAFQATTAKLSVSQYRVIISGLPDYIENIQLPVWSDKNGQDDVRWYTATKQADGSYIADISVARHHFDAGKYQAHIYIQRKNENKIHYLDPTSFTVDPITQAIGQLSVSNINSEEACFDVMVSDVFSPKGVRNVKVPVWSNQGGQDDIQWYTATKQTDGTYKVHVDLAKHGYVFGDYTVHAYIEQNNGELVGIGATQIAVPQPKQLTQISTSYQGTGAFQVTFNRVLTTGQVRYAVWSEANGQDDIRWYDANRTGNRSFQGWFTAQNHQGTGRYQIHAYQVVNGQMSGLGTAAVQVNKSNYSAPYFSQLDGRWSGIRYGAWTFGPTGCVPTVMAMLISGVKGTTVTPDQVGGYLHYNTLEFNRSFLGTSSRGVVLAAKNWGLRTETLNSSQALSKALQEGHFVAAGVGSSKFILAGGHELLLKGYSNGNTYVMDPYNSGNNGWYSIQYLWNVQSTDPIDRTEGAPFIKVTD